MSLIEINTPSGKPLVRLGRGQIDRKTGHVRMPAFLPTGPTGDRDCIGALTNTGGLVLVHTATGELVGSYTPRELVGEYIDERTRVLTILRAGAEQRIRAQAADKSAYIRAWVRSLTGSPQAAARVKVSRPVELEGGASAYTVTMPVGTARNLGLLSSDDRAYWFMPSRLTGYLGRVTRLAEVRRGRSLARVSLLVEPSGGCTLVA